MNALADCKFGYVEQDGDRYCHEHGSFQECWHENRSHCPRYVAMCAEAAAERRRVKSETSSSHVDSAPCDEDAPSALSRDTAAAEGVSKLPAPDAGGDSE